MMHDQSDDGESGAGGRLQHLLQTVDARNCVVVVSRWYGGVLLGPDRFKHINNAARTLLDACGYIAKTGKKHKGSASAGSNKGEFNDGGARQAGIAHTVLATLALAGRKR